IIFFFLLIIRPPPRPPLFPYTTLFRSFPVKVAANLINHVLVAGFIVYDLVVIEVITQPLQEILLRFAWQRNLAHAIFRRGDINRSEEHTSELQSRSDLVCRLLLEKKKG